MNDLEQKNLLQTEAQTTRSSASEDLELNDRELDAVSGGCDEYESTWDFWKRTDNGPNVLRHINNVTEGVGDWLKGLV